MKKLALLLILVLAFSCLFVACKPEPEAADPASPEVGKQRLIDQGSTARAIDHTGFRLVVNMTSGGDMMSVDIGGKDDVFWLDFEAIDAFLCEHEGKTYKYMPAPTSKWLKISDDSLKETIFTGAENLLFIGSEMFKEYMKKTGNESLGGRNCTTYSLSYKDPDTGKDIKAKAYLDIEYGLTLGIEVSEGEDVFSFTVDPLELSNPTLPDGYAAAKACDDFVESLL